MSADLSFECTKCKNIRLLNEFGTRQKDSNLGQKGDRLKKCLSCITTSSSSRKRKRLEANNDHPSKRFATQPAIEPSQFVEDWGNYASASEIDASSRISLDGMDLSDKAIADHLASLAWKATGYRFM